MTLQLGILLALFCAVASNLGFFFKHRGACACARVDIRHPLRTAKALWSSKWFAIGMLVGGLGWALHVAAISLAPLSVVQVVLSGGVVLIAVMADRIFGFSVGRRQWWGLALTAVGLVMLGLTMPDPDGAHSTFSSPAMIAFEAALFGIGGLLILGPRAGAPAEHHGVMLAAAAGILFGVCNVAVKALSGMAGDDGMIFGLLSPWLLVAAAASATAFYASARSLQDGEAVEVIAITGTAANIAGIAGGIIVFGDPMPGTALGIAIQGSPSSSWSSPRRSRPPPSAPPSGPWRPRRSRRCVRQRAGLDVAQQRPVLAAEPRLQLPANDVLHRGEVAALAVAVGPPDRQLVALQRPQRDTVVRLRPAAGRRPGGELARQRADDPFHPLQQVGVDGVGVGVSMAGGRHAGRPALGGPNHPPVGDDALVQVVQLALDRREDLRAPEDRLDGDAPAAAELGEVAGVHRVLERRARVVAAQGAIVGAPVGRAQRGAHAAVRIVAGTATAPAGC